MPLQIAWALLAALWNLSGVLLIAGGDRPLGPTATITGAIMLSVFAVLYPVTIRRWPTLYLILSIVTGLICVMAVVNTFTQAPALWPSEFWRYAGAALNAAGAVAAVAAIAGYTVWKRWAGTD